jgi:glycosyltransferase involved in cell wall biosynthesis
MKKLSIIIPVFNEEKTIQEVLEAVQNKKVAGWEKEVIVVDDGSTDKTRDMLKKWEKTCTILYHAKNIGKGGALATGMDKVSGEVLLIQDADLEYSPSDYDKLLEPFENPKVNVVYGSRFLGAHLSTQFVYTQGNKFVTFMTNILYNTNITDMETGYKVFRRDVVTDIHIHAKKFDFEPEFTAKILKRGFQIYEIPISYYGRTFLEGKKLTWKDGVVALWTLIKYKFVND